MTKKVEVENTVTIQRTSKDIKGLEAAGEFAMVVGGLLLGGFLFWQDRQAANIMGVIGLPSIIVGFFARAYAQARRWWDHE